MQEGSQKNKAWLDNCIALYIELYFMVGAYLKVSLSSQSHGEQANLQSYHFKLHLGFCSSL